MECSEGLKLLDDNCIDLTVTSPPYDDLRTYNGYSFNFENTAKELFRITKDGGVVVWIVNDKTIKGSKSGTSFKQALYFKDIGFRLHDVMIWEKDTFTDTGSLRVRYGDVFEYMFILSKGTPKTFNPIKDRKNKTAGSDKRGGNIILPDGRKKLKINPNKITQEYGQRFNVWHMSTCQSKIERTGHPAQFPEKLAQDHILSWSNENDIVLDPFMGSGTTAKMAKLNNRNYIGFEISKEYCDIAEERLKSI